MKMAFLWYPVFAFLTYQSSLAFNIPATRCYDCNFSPSGHVRDQTGWHPAETPEAAAGYQTCGQLTGSSPNLEDQWNCRSGVCFIRQDLNGLVYRGCADTQFLSWTIDPTKQCEYQGPDKSLYWFCDGDLCNGGHLGQDEQHCGSPLQPSKHYESNLPTGSYHLLGNDVMRGGALQDPVQDEDTPGRSDAEKAVVIVAANDVADKLRDAGADDEDGRVVEGQPHAYQQAQANICDGKCVKNPSGLFPDPHSPNHFIQCGVDQGIGNGCTCCKPVRLPCPPGTAQFDDDLKVCV